MKVSAPFQYPIEYKYRRWLVLSSSFFFLPAALALSCQVPCLGVLSLGTGIASVNFWVYGESDWRLLLDKTVAYSTFLTYCWIGFGNVKETWIVLSYLALFFNVVYSYQLSCYRWQIGCSLWIRYHIIFHICLTIGKMLVIVDNSDTCRIVFFRNLLRI